MTAVVMALGVLPGLYLRYHHVEGYPIDSQYGDMLPLVKSACVSFLRGEYPYTIHKVPYDLPLTFMPLLWGSYLPAVLFGLDLRIVGLAASAVIMILYLKIFHDQFRAAADVSLGQPEREGASAAALATLFLMLMFSYSTAITAFSIIGHTQPLWMYVALFAYFFLRDDVGPAAFFLALSVASRQTMVVLVPFAYIYWLKSLQRREVLKSALLFAGVTGVLCLPFAMVSPESFLIRPLHHYAELGRYYMAEQASQHHILSTFGFASLFYLNGLDGYLGAVSFAVWGFMVWRGSRGIDGRSSALTWMGVTLFLFYFFSPIPWFYIYIPALLLLSFAVIGLSGPVPRSSSGRIHS